MKTEKIWTIDEFISDAGSILSSISLNGPQLLEVNGKKYRIEAVEDVVVNKVKDVLIAGGPLENEDKLD